MPGNTLGPRGWYTYNSDSGTSYKILTDVSLATAAGLETAGAIPQLPRRFKPRIVHCEATVGGEKVRKELIIGASANAIYASEVGQAVTIDGTNFLTTGRRGERVTF